MSASITLSEDIDNNTLIKQTLESSVQADKAAPKDLTPEQLDLLNKKVKEDPDFAKAYHLISESFDLPNLPNLPQSTDGQPQKIVKVLSKERAAEIHHLLKDDKKFAKAFHTICNFVGLHMVGNSALSLFITYNIAPLKQTQQLIHGLADVVKPVISVWDSVWDKGVRALGLKKGISTLTATERAAQITQLSRSHTETAVMCIAGSIILLGVLPWENNRPAFVNWFDELIHPGKKAKIAAAKEEAKEHGIDIPPPPAEHKETLWSLLKVRGLALVPIFAINGMIESFNNSRTALNKPDLDTFIWKKGAELYDNVKPSTRDSFINFFSRKGQTVESIQPLVRDKLIKSVGNNTSRMIAAEQFRMFSKEIYLTIIYTGLLYVLGKTPIIPWTLKKLGFNKKDEREIENAIETDVGVNVLPFNDTPPPKEEAPAAEAKEEARPEHSFASQTKPRASLLNEPQKLHTKKLAAQELHADAQSWDRSMV